MAAQYDPNGATAKDRVRRTIGDRKSPFRWEDEEILAELAGGTDEAAVLRASIALLELEDVPGTVTQSVKQGSFARSKTVSGGKSSLIASLRERLALLGSGSDGAGPVGISEAGFPQPEGFPTVRPW